MRGLKYKTSKLVIGVLGLTTVLSTTFGFVPTAFAVTAATVAVPGTVSVSAGGATTNITGISVGGLSAGTTYLVAIGITNAPTGAVLKLPTTTGITASYGFTSGTNTFSSFKNISFRGNLTDVNGALAALQYVSGSSGSATNPTIRVTATSYDAGYSLNGLNGHYYKSSSPTTNTYTNARTAAKALTYKGMSGYLVTITNAEENTFVASNIESAASVWIGATDEITEGDWKWDTNGGSPEAGTSFWSGLANGSAVNGNYQSWNPGSEPNDSGGEDYAVTNWGGSSNGLWNDCNNSGCGANRLYVIEFGNNSEDAGFVNASSDLGSATFSISYKPIITGANNILNANLGTILYETVTATAGTGNKNFTLTNSPANSGITIDTSITNRAVLKIGNTVGAGTYTSTITATDTAGISSTYVVTTNISNPSGSETDSAISLNGSNQYAAAVSDESGFDISNAITIEAWIYPTGSSCNGNIVGKATSYFIYCNSGILQYAMGGQSNWSGVSTGVTIPTNEWHHIAMTREASSATAKIYLDGNLAYTGTSDGAGTSGLTNSNAPNFFNIGARNGSTTFFTGQIDEVKLWNVARNQTQVQSDLKSYGGALSDGLVAYYDFNELVGTTLLNRSTGGSSTLDLTLSNSPTLSSIAIQSVNLAYTITTFPRTYLVAAGGWKVPSGVNSIKYLVVAGGGGGGGGYNGGGGGAGGYRESSTAISSNTFYKIEVGVGGAGASGAIGNTSGTNSRISNLLLPTDSITASGGGRGSTEQTIVSGPNAGSNPDGRNESGGSGGGGGHSATTATTWGTNVSGAPGNIGGYSPAEGFAGGAGNSTSTNGCCYALAGGGGGGAGGVGGSASSDGLGGVPGAGGIGRRTFITGSALNLAGGGGGGGRYGNVAGPIVRGSSASFGGGNGAQNTSAEQSGTFNGVNGSNNTGGGGGGGASTLGTAKGGNGGSGIIIIAYITNTPTILTQPLSDTTTAGVVETFTITTSVAPTPLTKSVQWQFTSDTTTGTTGWTNVAAGTGITTDNFTTVALTNSMNKYRYRAIVTFSDTSTLSVVETSTVAILTINDSITISSSTSAITQKYGNTQVVRNLAYSGGTTNTGAVGTSTSHTVTSTNGPLAGGKIYLDTSTSTTYIKVDTGTAAGSYSLNVTITDFKGATSSYTQSIVVSKADTLTVQADTLTAITYSPSGMTINPTTTTTGLVAGDTASSITYTYSASSATCANGGLCNIGDIGPSGGYVFYVSPTVINVASGISTGGIYLEAAPVAAQGTALYGCSGTQISGTSYAIGSGAANTLAIVNNCATAGIAARVTSNLTYAGFSDWFMPSLDEMTAIYNNLYNRTPSLGGFTGLDYGSSSQGTTGAGYQAYWWFGAGAVSGQTDKNTLTSYRPIRAFNPIYTSTLNYGPSTTKPTNAGTYTITPSALSLTNGISTDNYVYIDYRSSLFTINKATQARLAITSKIGVYTTTPSTMRLITTGGTDTGTVTYAIAPGGSANTCVISGDSLSARSTGTCNVVATKASTINYLIAYSDTVTITFEEFVSNQQVQTQSVPTQLPINGANSLETNTVTIPVITSIVYDPGGTRLVNGNFQNISPNYTINGSGFTGATRLVLNFNDFAPFTILSDSAINVSASFGITGGPVFIECSDGRMGPVPFWMFTP